MSGRLVREIRQTKPFGSPEEEAVLNVFRTAAVLEQAEAEVLRPRGLSCTQYNALRILRGAGPAGLACGAIADRMVRRDPDVTRLLDRLESRGLVVRARAERDRRIVVARIRREGLDLLASLDPAVRDLPRRLLSHLGSRRVRALIDLLEAARGFPLPGSGLPGARPRRRRASPARSRRAVHRIPEATGTGSPSMKGARP